MVVFLLYTENTTLLQKSPLLYVFWTSKVLKYGLIVYWVRPCHHRKSQKACSYVFPLYYEICENTEKCMKMGLADFRYYIFHFPEPIRSWFHRYRTALVSLCISLYNKIHGKYIKDGFGTDFKIYELAYIMPSGPASGSPICMCIGPARGIVPMRY